MSARNPQGEAPTRDHLTCDFHDGESSNPPSPHLASTSSSLTDAVRVPEEESHTPDRGSHSETIGSLARDSSATAGQRTRPHNGIPGARHPTPKTAGSRTASWVWKEFEVDDREAEGGDVAETDGGAAGSNQNYDAESPTDCGVPEAWRQEIARLEAKFQAQIDANSRTIERLLKLTSTVPQLDAAVRGAAGALHTLVAANHDSNGFS